MIEIEVLSINLDGELPYCVTAGTTYVSTIHSHKSHTITVISAATRQSATVLVCRPTTHWLCDAGLRTKEG